MSPFVLSYYILATVLLLLAVIFVFVPTPPHPGLRNYRISLRLFALSYLTLMVYCLIKSHYSPALLSIPFLIAAPLEAVFLAFSHVILIHPQAATRTTVCKNLLPLVLFILLEGLQSLLSEHVTLKHYERLLFLNNGYTPGQATDVLLRELWLLAYAILIFHYGRMYFREEKRYKILAGDYSSENFIVNLPIARASFICALCVGVTTLLITFSLSETFSICLNYLILVLYVAMALLYLQYPKVFLRIYSILFEKQDRADAPDYAVSQSRWREIRLAIVCDGLYRRKGITIDDVALHFSMNRTMVSHMVNAHEKMNFNAFINHCRIDEARELIARRPEQSFAEIADTVGYSEQSNFARQFRLVTGITPSQYRYSLLLKK